MYTPEELALELGGKIKYADGTVFNSAGRSGVHRIPKAAPKPEPAAPALPPESDVLMRQMVEFLGVLAMQKPAAVEVPPAQVVIQPAAPLPKPVLDWTFDFIRNADGTIKSIRAKATKE